MSQTYVVLDDPALVNGIEYEAGAIVPVDDDIKAEFGTSLTQDHVGWTAAQWASGNPVMVTNHFGVEADTGLSKLGDNATAWNALAYAPDTFDVTPIDDVSTQFSRYATATPALADTMVVNDTSDSGHPKVITLTQLKAALA